MPPGPKTLVMLDHGPQEAQSTVPVVGDVSLYFNRAQVAQAHRQIYYRPSSSLSTMARNYRPPLHARYLRQDEGLTH